MLYTSSAPFGAETLQPGGKLVRSPRGPGPVVRFEEGEAPSPRRKANPVRDDFRGDRARGARHNFRNTGSAPLRFYTSTRRPEQSTRGRATKAIADAPTMNGTARPASTRPLPVNQVEKSLD